MAASRHRLHVLDPRDHLIEALAGSALGLKDALRDPVASNRAMAFGEVASNSQDIAIQLDCERRR